MSRKVGVGFNRPRVLHDGERQDWRARYDLMRRMTRLPKGTRRAAWWQAPIASSVVETMRKIRIT